MECKIESIVIGLTFKKNFESSEIMCCNNMNVKHINVSMSSVGNCTFSVCSENISRTRRLTHSKHKARFQKH